MGTHGPLSCVSKNLYPSQEKRGAAQKCRQKDDAVRGPPATKPWVLHRRIEPHVASKRVSSRKYGLILEPVLILKSNQKLYFSTTEKTRILLAEPDFSVLIACLKSKLFV